MTKKVKADLERLDILRDQALCGPEDKREESQQAYEELRSELLAHDNCRRCDEDVVTKKLSAESISTETTDQHVEKK